MGAGVSSHVNSDLLSFVTHFFPPTLLTTRASSLSRPPFFLSSYFISHLLCLPFFFFPFCHPSSISELFNSCTEAWEGEGRFTPAVQRERERERAKEIIMEE